MPQTRDYFYNYKQIKFENCANKSKCMKKSGKYFFVTWFTNCLGFCVSFYFKLYILWILKNKQKKKQLDIMPNMLNLVINRLQT